MPEVALSCYEYLFKSIPKKYGAITVYILAKLQAGAFHFTKNEFFRDNIKDFTMGNST